MRVILLKWVDTVTQDFGRLKMGHPPMVETNRIFPSCAGKKPPASKSSSADKGKATGAPSPDGGAASKKPARGQAKTHTRLTHG